MALTLLSTGADALAVQLPKVSTDVKVTDDYTFPEGNRPVVPANEHNCAWEISTISVVVTTYGDDEMSDIQVGMVGYPLTAKMVRSKSKSFGSVEGRWDCAVQWNLIHSAVMATVNRLNLDMNKIYTDKYTETFEQYKARKKAEYAAEAQEMLEKISE